MQRRTLLLFALFVVTAWFYSSMAQKSTAVVAQKQQEQIQTLHQTEPVLSGAGESEAEQDQG